MLVLSLLAFPALTHAADAVSSEKEALAEYQAGVKLAAGKKWKEAEERFARVAAFRAAPPVLLALDDASGRCQAFICT